MKKKMKVLVGLCLAAVLALGGVGRYARAASESITIVDIENGNVIKTKGRGFSTIGKMSGTAYTEPVANDVSYCTVSATFTWYDSNNNDNNDNVLYSNGNGAGGMHGAGVSMSYPYEVARVYSAEVTATHTVSLTTGGDGWCTTHEKW